MFLVNVEKCLELFDKVYVSSEDEDILDWADSRGAIAIKRPKELCGDTPNIPVYKHAINFMGMVDGIVAVQANSPNVLLETISEVRDLMEKFEEVMTIHSDGRIYGSVWGVSKKRLENYTEVYDFFNPEPEAKVFDMSTDIHTLADYNYALKQYGK